jgi:hypothetical protein
VGGELFNDCLLDACFQCHVVPYSLVARCHTLSGAALSIRGRYTATPKA